MDAPLIELRQVSKRYDDGPPAVDDLTASSRGPAPAATFGGCPPAPGRLRWSHEPAGRGG